MKAYMYILRCANGEYYTGSTKNLERRLAQHADLKGSNFTHKHIPFELVYKEEFTSIKKAHQREKQIQGWSRAKKEALISGDIEKLKSLSAGKKNKNSGFKYNDAIGNGEESRVAE
jgi:putative endonuclease